METYFLRAYLPHEKGWMFRWIFSHVLVQMFSLTVLKKTRIIISDGDAQEFGQLDNAIDRFFPNTIRVRCGWHLIDRSWEKHFIKKSHFPEEAKDYYDILKKNIQTWMYTWMKPSCEFLEEYQFFKYLLLRYVNSPRVVEQISTMMYDSLVKYLNNYIVTHEYKYLFC